MAADGFVVFGQVLDPTLLIPTLLLIGSLLLGALIIAAVRYRMRSAGPLSPTASDQLAEFRAMYEQGKLSKEDYQKLRAVLGGEIRRANNLPDAPSSAPAAEPKPPESPDGIRPQ